MITPHGKYDLKLLQSIKDFYLNKTTKIQDDDNILIKYLKSPDIIRDFKTNNLSLFINELLKKIEVSNIILPFIEPIGDLIDIYINTNDNKIDDSTWEKLFVKLLENSFFNKENLIPIYSYFTEIYSDVDKINESDERMLKFNKYINIWKLIYLNSQNKIPLNSSISSFCNLGTGFELIFPNQFPYGFVLNIRLNFIDQNFLEYVNPNDFFIKSYNSSYKYAQLNSLGLPKIVEYINFQYSIYSSNKTLWILVNNNEKGLLITLYDNNPRVTILNNFYGQIRSIKVSFHNSSTGQEIIKSKEIFPFPLKDNEGIIFHSSYEFLGKVKIKNPAEEFYLNIYNDPFIDKISFSFQINAENYKLFKTNYINFKEKQFNIIKYFGGIVQFLPFLNIINGLYNNKNLILINNKEKKDVLIDFAKYILLVIYKYVNNCSNEQFKKLENYWTFFFYVINKIEPFNSKEIKIDLNEFKTNQTNNNIYSKMLILFLKYINTKSINDGNLLKNLIRDYYINKKGKEGRMDKISFFWKTNEQLYRHLMKQLFVYNRLWSKQYLFFNHVNKCYKRYNNKDNLYQIKYKRINYYTSNFQQPLIYPILEISNYNPPFKKFKPKENLYKNQTDKILDYDFSLDKFKDCVDNEFIKNYIDFDNNDSNYFNNNNLTNNKFDNFYEECCLVKRMYHVKGRLCCLRDNINKNFVFYFLSDINPRKKTCNAKDDSKLCYGSIFSSMKKENKRYIYIPKEKIVFAIIRIYYHRVSGIEIFTSDNKSYYFNFTKPFRRAQNTNKIFNEFEINFKSIELDFKLIGWYNPDFKKFYYPLFSEFIDKWNEKFVYSNFDKLMIINLFSNRSFHDLNQYPVFPMLYNEIGFQRTMNKHIGFQELEEESKKRTQLIKDSYLTEKEYSETDNNDICYFSILFSNINYVCNYLLRVYPYSFIAIEIQGDRFDTADRLFYSISSTMYNNLSQRADLRELIPEMFYFPPLFSNINDVNLGKLRDGTKIDNVIINNDKENNLEKFKFFKKMRYYLENEQNLNQWIDLIFGVNKEFYEKKERYYSINNNVEYISIPEIFNDDLKLQACDFGVLPAQLFSRNFPKQNEIKKDIEESILEHNSVQYKNTHFHVLNDEEISFICIGEKGNNSNYYRLINKSKKFDFFEKIISFKKDFNEIVDCIHYLFVGNIFGHMSIYRQKPLEKLDIKKDNSDFYENNPEKQFLQYINNGNYVLIAQLFDHTKEIKYIDYNPRLNLLADYSLDGFINIYTMPTLKLVRVIQTQDHNISGKIKKIALISNPFPMICCVSELTIFIWDINGEIINSYKISKGNEVEFCIDKDFGRFNDFMIFNQNGSPKNMDFI